jgi:hypothetical protein
MEELIKRQTGDAAAEDFFAFQKLGESDREDIGEYLGRLGFNYYSID